MPTRSHPDELRSAAEDWPGAAAIRDAAQSNPPKRRPGLLTAPEPVLPSELAGSAGLVPRPTLRELPLPSPARPRVPSKDSPRSHRRSTAPVPPPRTKPAAIAARFSQCPAALARLEFAGPTCDALRARCAVAA